MARWAELLNSLGPEAVRQAVQGSYAVWSGSDAARTADGAVEVALAREAASWEVEVARATNDGKRSSLLGCEIVLRYSPEWQGVLAYDCFANNLVKRIAPPFEGGEPGQWEDADTYRLIAWFHREWRFQPSESDLSGALSNVSRLASFHPVREYLEGLPKRRIEPGDSLLDVWLAHGMGATDNPIYLANVGRWFMIGAVARVMEPGCKMDNMLVLDGEQDKGKSTALLRLFDPWSSDQPIIFGDKDAYLALDGIWMLELAEMDAYSRADVKASKAFLSQRRDRYRPPYGHRMVNNPRQCVFGASTNQFEYLKDATGNRRNWPVRVQKVRMAWLAEVKDALWAEALQAYQDGARWWADTEEEKALCYDAQDQRVMEDPWEESIGRFLLNSSSGQWSTETLLREACYVATHSITKAHQGRLAECARALGLVKHRWTEKIGKKSVRIRGYRLGEKGLGVTGIEGQPGAGQSDGVGQ